MGITSRLKVMSFLQYFIWGAGWLPPAYISTPGFYRRECRYGLQLKRVGSDYHAGHRGSLLITVARWSLFTCFAIWFARGRYCTPPPPIPDDKILGDVG